MKSLTDLSPKFHFVTWPRLFSLNLRFPFCKTGIIGVREDSLALLQGEAPAMMKSLNAAAILIVDLDRYIIVSFVFVFFFFPSGPAKKTSFFILPQFGLYLCSKGDVVLKQFLSLTLRKGHSRALQSHTLVQVRQVLVTVSGAQKQSLVPAQRAALPSPAAYGQVIKVRLSKFP